MSSINTPESARTNAQQKSRVTFTITQKELDEGVFHPSLQDFEAPDDRYVYALLSYRQNKARGIIKIVPPTEWLARQQPHDFLKKWQKTFVKPIIPTIAQLQVGTFKRSYIDQHRRMLSRYMAEEQEKAVLLKKQVYSSVEQMTKDIFENITWRKPEYVIDHEGSWFEDNGSGLNLKTGLQHVLSGHGVLPGITTSMLYFGSFASVFCTHKEDMDLHSIGYNHYGDSKIWFSLRDEDVDRFEQLLRQTFADELKHCEDFVRHKVHLMSPEYLKSHGIPIQWVEQRAGEFVITMPRGYHWGYNAGFNVMEAKNFGTGHWVKYGKAARNCRCKQASSPPLNLHFDLIEKQLAERPFLVCDDQVVQHQQHLIETITLSDDSTDEADETLVEEHIMKEVVTTATQYKTNEQHDRNNNASRILNHAVRSPFRDRRTRNGVEETEAEYVTRQWEESYYTTHSGRQ